MAQAERDDPTPERAVQFVLKWPMPDPVMRFDMPADALPLRPAGDDRPRRDFAELGAEKPHGEFIEAVTRLVAWFDSANSNPEKPLDWAALSAETNEVRRHEADGHRMVVWRSAAGKEYRLIVASHDPPDGEFTFDFQDGQGLVCTNLTIPAANAVRWALQVVRDKRAPDGRGRR